MQWKMTSSPASFLHEFFYVFFLVRIDFAAKFLMPQILGQSSKDIRRYWCENTLHLSLYEAMQNGKQKQNTQKKFASIWINQVVIR